ncbi:MAG: 2-phosphosulfolactate phosphatase [Nitriliruptorales bacterium]
MRIDIVTPDACENLGGAAVIVDVMRAFTTAAYAFEAGAREIILVETVEDALSVREHLGGLAMGEVGGESVPEFDLGNSPREVRGRHLDDQTVVQRTSNGTQAVAKCAQADPLLATSFVCAEATVRMLRNRQPERVTFVVTGVQSDREGDEDYACAEYLVARLRGRQPDVGPYLERVRASDVGKHFARGGENDHEHSPQDLELALDVDRFSRAMLVTWRGDLAVLHAVEPF